MKGRSERPVQSLYFFGFWVGSLAHYLPESSKNQKLSSSVGTRELKISPPGEYFPASFRNDAGRRLRRPLRSVPYKLVFLSFSSSIHTCWIEN
ncbi:hypothetical protein ACFX15_018667 [Malus domestica]